jgi:hypothetical protein
MICKLCTFMHRALHGVETQCPVQWAIRARGVFAGPYLLKSKKREQNYRLMYTLVN